MQNALPQVKKMLICKDKKKYFGRVIAKTDHGFVVTMKLITVT